MFVKAPRPGEVKTRLTPFLTPQAAAEVAACLARDAVRCAGRSLPEGGRLVIVFAPDNSGPEIESELSGPSTEYLAALPPVTLPQRGVNLGERMANAVKDAATTFNLGPLVLVGADCPLMPPGVIQAAFSHLGDGTDSTGQRPDIVLGPAADGGYYLLALRSEHAVSELLAGVDWSTERVFSQTIGNAERLAMRCFTGLSQYYDIDTPEDLVHLRNDFLSDPSLQERSPEMAGWLSKNTLPSLSVSGADERPETIG